MNAERVAAAGQQLCKMLALMRRLKALCVDRIFSLQRTSIAMIMFDVYSNLMRLVGKRMLHTPTRGKREPKFREAKKLSQVRIPNKSNESSRARLQIEVP